VAIRSVAFARRAPRPVRQRSINQTQAEALAATISRCVCGMHAGASISRRSRVQRWTGVRGFTPRRFGVLAVPASGSVVMGRGTDHNVHLWDIQEGREILIAPSGDSGRRWERGSGKEFVALQATPTILRWLCRRTASWWRRPAEMDHHPWTSMASCTSALQGIPAAFSVWPSAQGDRWYGESDGQHARLFDVQTGEEVRRFRACGCRSLCCYSPNENTWRQQRHEVRAGAGRAM